MQKAECRIAEFRIAERQKAEFSPSKAKFPVRIAPLKGGIAQGQIFFKFIFKIYFKAIIIINYIYN